MTGRVFGQGAYRGRFEWGLSGAEAVTPGVAVVAVVDVLSFTTALSVAVENGIAVMPYPWRDGTAAAVARRHRAELAVGRSVAGPDEVSLSPAVMRRVASRRRIERLVLPSPNGSAISARLARLQDPDLASSGLVGANSQPMRTGLEPVGANSQPMRTGLESVGAHPEVVRGSGGVTVVGVGLRNAAAAREWVRRRAEGRAVAVVAAGERWVDGSLRPAVEDLWGAGAFLDGMDGLSPEASAAVAAYRAVADRIGEALQACASGRELAAAGFAEDVAVAAEVDQATAVPVLQDGWYRPGK
ncbi:putative lipoprotein [Actinoplanes sp. SE50]|uniref:2-phosphosulfolactate phosphatase n=1 Tax=unclassified Actinoplanes TaxID=2626549 RepID=UPI00023EBC2D|nr:MULTISPECIES: 2-phosphosulfolactate phosphatase [unclassified Actinoplanes]AEV87384.1 putative lipoprotein [Actinoplanes sp. SE50/110]ATO85786.1 putative lipoprotein [Actinoplanes sp. SE50]SLM03199.1 hypothetical protein ACSP50_6488 [Actinoplanes sp. SE50/110]